VGSAPSFPHNIIDPIKKLGELAIKYDLGLHVDACLGGFVLPFANDFNIKLESFDFRVDGVTSIRLFILIKVVTIINMV
jgi:sphinganine-1-phosphate aldolase